VEPTDVFSDYQGQKSVEEDPKFIPSVCLIHFEFICEFPCMKSRSKCSSIAEIVFKLVAETSRSFDDTYISFNTNDFANCISENASLFIQEN
jgi:hypothetical protein